MTCPPVPTEEERVDHRADLEALENRKTVLPSRIQSPHLPVCILVTTPTELSGSSLFQHKPLNSPWNWVFVPQRQTHSQLHRRDVKRNIPRNWVRLDYIRSLKRSTDFRGTDENPGKIKGVYGFSKTSGPVVGPTQSPIKWVPRGLYTGLNNRSVKLATPPTAKVENEWRYTPFHHMISWHVQGQPHLCVEFMYPKICSEFFGRKMAAREVYILCYSLVVCALCQVFTL
jgi:hypothetical protein